MRISAFTNFKKLWGKIKEENIPKGTYKLKITNNWDISKFSGDKQVIFSQVNYLGGQNYFLGYSYLGVGCISLILAILFIIQKIRRPKGLVEKKLNEAN